MKVGILIPTRGDRPEFLKNALRLIDKQTVKVHRVEIIGDPPKSDECDITYRYRTGYEKLSDVDLIFFWEDDDFYHRTYLQYMIDNWMKKGKPDMLGTRYTIYYHLKIRKYFRMWHEQRSSAMNTVIRPNLKLTWGRDNNPYTDVQLWLPAQLINTQIIDPPYPIAIGIKHGLGKTGGNAHVDNLHRYINDDPYMNVLQHMIDDDEQFEWYKKLSESMQ